MDLYRARSIAINSIAYTTCIVAPVVGALTALEHLPPKQMSLEHILNGDILVSPEHVATTLAGAVAGLIVSVFPVTFTMRYLEQLGYIGRRNSSQQ